STAGRASSTAAAWRGGGRRSAAMTDEAVPDASSGADATTNHAVAATRATTTATTAIAGRTRASLADAFRRRRASLSVHDAQGQGAGEPRSRAMAARPRSPERGGESPLLLDVPSGGSSADGQGCHPRTASQRGRKVGPLHGREQLRLSA